MSLPAEELRSLIDAYRYLIKQGQAGDREALAISKHYPYEATLVEDWASKTNSREVRDFAPSLARRFPDLLG